MGMNRGERGFGIWVVAALVALVGFVVAWQFVGPAPPDAIVLATGSEGGAYARFGRRLAKRVEAASGIDVQVRNTSGSLENLRLLRDGSADVAYVQSGTVSDDDVERLAGIASLYYEPLWIFHRSDLPVERLTDLVGRRLSVGQVGSGTRSVTLLLLAENGITDEDATLLELSKDEAVDGLLGGTIDALFLVTSARSDAVRRLMQHEGDEVRLFDVQRHLAYAQSHRFLRKVVLGEGMIDMQANRPDRDVALLAPTATLVADAELHDAVVPLLIEAARAIHGPGDLFEDDGEFPGTHGLDTPLSLAADHYYENGPSFLYRVLPFSVAAVIDRLKILLLPLITLLLPLLKIVPPVYRWRIRSKIFRWYRDIRRVEIAAGEEDADVAKLLGDLESVEREVAGVSVPPSYMEELYNLSMHLDLVRAKIRPRREAD